MYCNPVSDCIKLKFHYLNETIRYQTSHVCNKDIQLCFFLLPCFYQSYKQHGVHSIVLVRPNGSVINFKRIIFIIIHLATAEIPPIAPISHTFHNILLPRCQVVLHRRRRELIKILANMRLQGTRFTQDLSNLWCARHGVSWGTPTRP